MSTNVPAVLGLPKLAVTQVTLSGHQFPYSRVGIGALQDLANLHPVLLIFIGRGQEIAAKAVTPDQMYDAQAALVALAVGSARGVTIAQLANLTREIREGVVPSEIEQAFHEIMTECFPMIAKAFEEARAQAEAAGKKTKAATPKAAAPKRISTPKTR